MQRDRVIPLHQWVEKFVNRDGLAGPVALGKVLALEHSGHGVAGCELN